MRGTGECRQARLLPDSGHRLLSLAPVQRARSLRCVTSFSEQLASDVRDSPRDCLQSRYCCSPLPSFCHTVSLAQRLPDFHFKSSGSGFTSHDHVWTKHKLRQQKSVFLKTHRDFWALGVLFVFRVLEIKSLSYTLADAKTSKRKWGSVL